MPARLAPASAQTPADPKSPAAAAATSSKPETVEQRITTLKAALKITPDQEPKWTAVAQAMRDSASQMEKLVATKRAIPPEKTTAVDDLKTYEEFTEMRLDGLKKVNSAFKSLYDAMPAAAEEECRRGVREVRPVQARHRRARRSIMTSSKRIGLAASLVLGLLSVAAVAAPASAAWWGNGQYQPDNRYNNNNNNNHNNRYYGYHYRDAAGRLRDALQLRLPAAAGHLRQHARASRSAFSNAKL